MIASEILDHYGNGQEEQRLARSLGRLERLRTEEIVGIQGGMLRDAAFSAIVEQDLADGIHQNPTNRPEWFTTAYFHRPEEIRPEIEEAGLRFDSAIAVEGPGWVPEALDAWLDDAAARERLLRVLRRIETEPSLIGASAHVIAVARK